MRRLVPTLLLICGVLAAMPVVAAEPAPLPDWNRLTPAQRELLIDPVRERWNANPQARGHMLQRAERWRSMTPEQRSKARSGMDRFHSMTPAQREESRAIFQRLRQMSPAERATARTRLHAMTPEQRREWLRGVGDPPAR